MEDPEIITATEASRAFSDMLHRVCYGGESFIIKKGCRLMARIMPVEVGEQLKASEIFEPEEKAAIADNATSEESEYYSAWMEQVRKNTLVPCE